MYFPCIILLLFAVLSYIKANSVTPQSQPCNGGYCVPKHLCSTVNQVPSVGQNGRLTVLIDERNECGDFMKICCKPSPINSPEVAASKCGMSNPDGLVYYVESNLMYTKYAEFPWTVAIFQMNSLGLLTHVGGGTLIHPKFVLTAAYILNNYFKYLARFGEWSLRSNAEKYATQDIEIVEYIPHPSYRGTIINENDIALAKLKESVIYSEHIRPLCLPSAREQFDGQRCIATGWGLDIRTGQPSSTMKRMEQSIISRTNCQLQFWELGMPYWLHPSTMCAKGTKEQNACMNDEGAPLACQRNDGSYVLAGILSGVWQNCGRPDYPQVYVDVAKFTCWINDTIEGYAAEEEKKINNQIMVRPIQYLFYVP